MSAKARLKSYRTGMWAEILAVVIFRLKGYRILARRYKCKMGEIDVLLVKGRMLIAVEVKYRQTHDGAVHSIHRKNRRRVQRALEHFLMCSPAYQDYGLRFDVFVVNRGLRFHHLDNAWQAESY